MALPYGGATLLADTSAWTNIGKRTIPEEHRDAFWQAVENRKIRSSPIVRLEIIWKARTKQEAFDKIQHITVPELELTPDIIARAMEGLTKMVAEPHDVKRVPIPDALIAATAQAHGIGVLHYDFTDFPTIAKFFEIEVVPIAAQGSI